MKNAPKTAKIRVTEIYFLAKYNILKIHENLEILLFYASNVCHMYQNSFLSKHVNFFWKFLYFSEIFETSRIFYSHNYIENCFKPPKISWNDAKFSRFIEFSIYFYQNASKCHGILFWSYFEYSEYISKLFWMSETLFVSAWTQKHRLMNWKRCILMILGTLHMFSA